MGGEKVSMGWLGSMFKCMFLLGGKEKKKKTKKGLGVGDSHKLA